MVESCEGSPNTAHFTVQTVWQTIIFLAPASLVKAYVTKTLELMGVRVVVDGDESSKTEKKTASHELQCTMTVHDHRFFKDFAVRTMFGHGEAYMNGWIDSSDLAKQIELITGEGSRSKDSWLYFMFQLRNKMVTARNLQTRGTKSMEVADRHYNLGNDLYSLMLDDSMNYSCAYWKDIKDDNNLKQAQINKMDLVARKLKLKPGMRVLDLGSGFGATAKYLAQNYGVTVVGYNISKEQLEFARESCKGLSVEFVEDDYRNAAQSGKFDRVYSIGFFEHVGRSNYREYFEIAESCLKDDGLLLTHAVTLRDASLPRTDDWIQKYVFPGGEIPHPQDYFDASEGILAVEDIHNFGTSYAKTLRVWEKNFIKNWPKLEEKYGPLLDGRFYRMWINYLEGCIGVFEGHLLHLYQVVHSKQGCKRGAPSYGYDSVR